MTKISLIQKKRKKYTFLLIVFFFIIFLISFLYASGIVRITLGSLNVISILSPENTTYTFNKGDNYTLDLNVSSLRELTEWRYVLEDIRHGIVYDQVEFVPNATFNAVRWSNKVTVFANDINNEIFNKSVEFFILVNNSSPLIENISKNIYLCENSYLSYLFNANDVDEDNLTGYLTPSYPQNPFYITFLTKTNLTTNQFHIFSGILNKEDSGGVNNGYRIYNETISVSDGEYSDNANTNITVIEVNNDPVIENIGVHTIWTIGENSTFYYKVLVNDIEEGNQDSENLSFNISFSGEKLFDISSLGVMNFTVNNTPTGVYYINVSSTDNGIENPYVNISLCGQDGGPITSRKQFSLTITDQNRQPNITSYYPLNSNLSGISSGWYFNVTTYDRDGTIPDVYWYVDNNLIFYDSGFFKSEFNYSFGCGSSGNHIVKVRITDGELNNFRSWNLSIVGVDCSVVPIGGGGSSGGGGGKVISNCTLKLGCSEWGVCQSLSIISKEDNLTLVNNQCSLNQWYGSKCGFQKRECFDISNCLNHPLKLPEVRACYSTEHPRCDDGIKNCHNRSCEVLIDCGGPCPACHTCSDNLKNQGEEGIDCGGPCPNCIEIPSKIKKNISNIFLLFVILSVIISIIMIVGYYMKKRKLDRLSR